MSIISVMLNLPPVRIVPLQQTPGQPRQAQSDAKIRKYLARSGPATVPVMADALGYTRNGLRMVIKTLEARGRVKQAGSVPGAKGRRVALWQWIEANPCQ